MPNTGLDRAWLRRADDRVMDVIRLRAVSYLQNCAALVRARRVNALVVRLTSCGLLLCAPAAGGQDASVRALGGDGPVVTRCAEQSAAHAQATERLERLNARVERLESSGPVDAVVAALHDLLRTECFLAAAETSRVPSPDTALSLKEWWVDAGGHHWLQSFLELPRLGLIDNLTAHVVVPPDVRTTLSAERHEDHPLRNMLCSLADAACGAETRGWKLRAEAHFEAHRAARRDEGPSASEKRLSAPEEISQQCLETSAAGSERRYERWRACIESARPQQTALPLGSFKTPKTGWFVIAGRRGHYDFCDTVRAYDLRTGAAFIDESCSALTLKAGGHVDVDVTNARRVRRVKAGVVSAENLREAVWMLLLRGETERVQLRAAYYPLPPGVTPQLTLGRDEGDSGGLSLWSSTAQTTLTWRWQADTGAALVGELTWPDSYDAAESHAASLLGIVEEGFVETCPPRQAPTMMGPTSARAHNLNDVPGDAADALERALQRAAAAWKGLRACGADHR